MIILSDNEGLSLPVGPLTASMQPSELTACPHVWCSDGWECHNQQPSELTACPHVGVSQSAPGTTKL